MTAFLTVQPALGFVWDIDAHGRVARWVAEASSANTNLFNPATRAIRYFLAADAYSSTNRVAEWNAIRAAFDQWQSIPGTSLRFEEGGMVEGRVDVHTSDGTNVVFWAKGDLRVNGGRDDVSNTLAVTFPRMSSENIILEADIVLNGGGVAWFTDYFSTNTTEQWIESTVLHEIGHMIGLKHSPVVGATMWSRSPGGINTQAGLSADEVAAARALYPKSGSEDGFGHLAGQVASSEGPVFGAVITAEDYAGNVAAATLSDAAGHFHLLSLPEGRYEVRATPLDPAANPSLARLISSADIDTSLAGANTAFLPAANISVVVTRGITNRLDFFVKAGTPAFRITRLCPATRNGTDFTAINAATVVRPGERSVLVGVFSPELTPGAVLRLTGSGIAIRDTRFRENVFPDSKPKLNLVSITIDLATNAIPGLRSFILEQGAHLAYANGALEILPAAPDFNFDGLDDRFQRRHFSRFTSAEAGPDADADHDGLTNAQEYLAESDPVNARSVLRIEQVTLSRAGTAIVWQSEPGKRYRLFRRAQSDRGPWVSVGSVLTATSKRLEAWDSSATNQLGFYRVQVLP